MLPTHTGRHTACWPVHGWGADKSITSLKMEAAGDIHHLGYVIIGASIGDYCIATFAMSCNKQPCMVTQLVSGQDKILAVVTKLQATFAVQLWN